MTATTTGRIAGAALLGAACGMRTFSGPAALAWRGAWVPGPGRLALFAAAGGEVVGDKLPMIPPRTSPGPLAGRLVSGALCGARLAGAPGVAAGALAAAAATFGLPRARAAVAERTGLPDPVVAVGEDALAAASALVATRGVASS